MDDTPLADSDNWDDAPAGNASAQYRFTLAPPPPLTIGGPDGTAAPAGSAPGQYHFTLQPAPVMLGAPPTPGGAEPETGAAWRGGKIFAADVARYGSDYFTRWPINSTDSAADTSNSAADDDSVDVSASSGAGATGTESPSADADGPDGAAAQSPSQTSGPAGHGAGGELQTGPGLVPHATAPGPDPSAANIIPGINPDGTLADEDTSGAATGSQPGVIPGLNADGTLADGMPPGVSPRSQPGVIPGINADGTLADPNTPPAAGRKEPGLIPGLNADGTIDESYSDDPSPQDSADNSGSSISGGGARTVGAGDAETYQQTLAALARSQQALADAQAGRKAYSYDANSGLQFHQETMADGLRQARADGVVDPCWAQEHLADFQKVQDAWQQLEKDAGGAQKLKALLHGGGIGAAFLLGALPGAKLGALAGAAVPGAGETGISELIGGAVGGLITGSTAAYLANKLADKLAAYSDLVRSVNASAQLHPGYDAAGQMIPMLLDAPAALSSVAKVARLASEAGTAADGFKVAAKIVGVRAASGAVFEGTVRPAFDLAKNAVLDTLHLPREDFQSPTLQSIATNAMLAVLSAGHDPHLQDYPPAQVASLYTRAQLREQAGIPPQSELTPAQTAQLVQRLGLPEADGSALAAPLTREEQGVFQSVSNKIAQARAGTPETSTQANPTPAEPSAQQTAESATIDGPSRLPTPAPAEGAPDAKVSPQPTSDSAEVGYRKLPSGPEEGDWEPIEQSDLDDGILRNLIQEERRLADRDYAVLGLTATDDPLKPISSGVDRSGKITPNLPEEPLLRAAKNRAGNNLDGANAFIHAAHREEYFHSINDLQSVRDWNSRGAMESGQNFLEFNDTKNRQVASDIVDALRRLPSEKVDPAINDLLGVLKNYKPTYKDYGIPHFWDGLSFDPQFRNDLINEGIRALSQFSVDGENTETAHYQFTDPVKYQQRQAQYQRLLADVQAGKFGPHLRFEVNRTIAGAANPSALRIGP